MSRKKALFLFLALLLPVCIFLFLKFFGKNQFDVAPLYQADLPEASCGIRYVAPYVLPDSVMQLVNEGNKHIPLFIVNFSTSDAGLNRVLEEVTPEEVRIVRASNLSLDPTALTFIRDCVLLMKPTFDLVLIDNQHKIRGYYKTTDREEIDRLLVELEIILKKY
jgi:hypothetical protein